MKRQGKKQGPTAASAALSEKRIKMVAEEMEREQTKEEEEERVRTTPENAEALAAAVAAAAAAAAEEEEGLWGMGMKGADVDEQMSWGAVWLPFWDVEFVGRNYGALFSDVVWDDDIWNLKSVTEVPNAT